MKQLLPLLLIYSMSISTLLAQFINPTIITKENQEGKIIRCYTSQKMEEARNLDPMLIKRRAKMERDIEQFLEEERMSGDTRATSAVYQIPVVVHILYRTSQENISDARVLEQIQVLNNDYRRTNADAGNTPAVFAGVAADCEIEFCLATKDPQGNTTTGITRTQTTVSNIGQGNKYYSTAQGGMNIWNPSQYMNIWVCAIGGGVLGYTYTPGGAPSGADGIVVDYKYFGKTGTSAPYNGGRTTTHEVGHWLNLEHIWGGGNGGCSQDDGVSDTPMQYEEYGGCSTHPQTSCGSADMFMNYMDYSDDACMNIFTLGQKNRMRAAISVARPGLLTSIACVGSTNDAGVLQINEPTGTICSATFVPKVTIKNFGSASLSTVTINYRTGLGPIQTQVWTGSLTTNQTATVTLPQQTLVGGNHTFYAWTSLPNGLADGFPSNDNSSSIFSVSNDGLTLPFSQGFEGTTFPPAGWTIDNPDGDITWARTTKAAKTGNASMYMNTWNYSPLGEKDQITLPSLDFSNSNTVTMTFELAYALYSSTGYSDTLRVWASTDCGLTWSKVYDKAGTALTTISQLIMTEFIPTPNQWRMEIIDLTALSAANNVKLRFEHISDYENNLYVDNINITNTPSLGFSSIQAKGSLRVFPNPTTGLLNIEVGLPSENKVDIMVYNTLGQVVSRISDSNVMTGSYKINMEHLAKGIYHIQVVAAGEMMTQKVVLQ